MKTSEGQPLGRVLGLGTFTTHLVCAAAQCIPVPADLSPAATCLIGCGVATGVGAALYAAPVTPGSTVAVFGCGAIGMSVIQGARLAHAARIVAVDLAQKKLEWALRFGATDVVDASAGDPVKKIRELTGGGVTYAFEAVGLPQTLQQAASSTELGGTCVLIGVPVPGATFSLSMVKFFYGRVTLKATFCGDTLPARDFPLLADWYRKKTLDLDGLVTQTLDLSQVEEAFNSLKRGDTLRSVLVP
jgi:S-(hydroxymethyl)mycothiol dehydrogenase